MLRTNCKKAISNIHNYIIENADFSNYGMETPEDFKSVANQIMKIFYDEMVNEWNRQRKPYQELFIEWLKGLPSAIDSCYYYNRSAKKDVMNILEETEAEAERYSEAEAERLLSCLIWREIYKACNYTILKGE